MEALDVVLLVLRGWLGAVMIAHGWSHARRLDGTARWFASVGFRAAPLQARTSAVGEVAAGGLLLAGLLTGPAAAVVVAFMVVAFWSIHRFAGFFVYARPDEGYEYVVTLAVVATAVAVLGPGAVSIDAVLGLGTAGPVGLALVGGGVLAGAAHLSLTWRRPST